MASSRLNNSLEVSSYISNYFCFQSKSFIKIDFDRHFLAYHFWASCYMCVCTLFASLLTQLATNKFPTPGNRECWLHISVFRSPTPPFSNRFPHPGFFKRIESVNCHWNVFDWKKFNFLYASLCLSRLHCAPNSTQIKKLAIFFLCIPTSWHRNFKFKSSVGLADI